MGRPSLAAERREQILEAFERCLVERGLEATTLEAVAAEAGVQRAAIRHFVGNRDELIAASVDHLTAKYGGGFARALPSLPRGAARIDALLDHLFLGGFLSDLPREGRVLDALFAASAQEPEARRALRRMYGAFEKLLVGELSAAYPRADAARARGIAYALVCLSEENAGLQELGFPRSRARDARAAARLLVESLAAS